ncbi:MAG: 50S ribosomal protein L18Ae [Thermocladium sp.]|jgi:large subunit ribosomal protein LX
MSVRVYRVKGMFRDVDGWKNIEKDVVAINEMDAKEKIYTYIGGLHRVKRHLIRIESVEALDPSMVSNKELHQLLSLDRLVIFGEQQLR